MREKPIFLPPPALRGSPYPLRIRRAGYGGATSVGTATATASVSASNLDDYAAVEGDPADIKGSIPQRGDGAITVVVSIIPRSLSSLSSHAATDRVGTWTGTGNLFLYLWQNGEKFPAEFPVGDTSQGGTIRYVAFNYEYGTNDVNVQGFAMGQLATPSWDPPYVPDQISLKAVVYRASLVVTLKVLFLWEK